MVLETLPARSGRALKVGAGEAVRIVNTHGSQVVDLWAFSAADLTEFLSMEHLRPAIGGVFVRAGMTLVSNRRRPILDFETDTSPGVHDTLIAACDPYRYAQLGCEGPHDNCTDNLFAAMRALGLEPPECPSPLNLWMNIPVGPDGSVSWGEPVSAPGDAVVLRARIDCVVAMSACPQDMLPINGADRRPTEAHFERLDHARPARE